MMDGRGLRTKKYKSTLGRLYASINLISWVISVFSLSIVSDILVVNDDDPKMFIHLGSNEEEMAQRKKQWIFSQVFLQLSTVLLYICILLVLWFDYVMGYRKNKVFIHERDMSDIYYRQRCLSNTFISFLFVIWLVVLDTTDNVIGLLVSSIFCTLFGLFGMYCTFRGGVIIQVLQLCILSILILTTLVQSIMISMLSIE